MNVCVNRSSSPQCVGLSGPFKTVIQSFMTYCLHNFFVIFSSHTHTHTVCLPACVLRCPGCCGAVLSGPESGSPVRRVPLPASAARIHLRHAGRDPGALQDTGECV